MGWILRSVSSWKTNSYCGDNFVQKQFVNRQTERHCQKDELTDRQTYSQTDTQTTTQTD